MFYYTYVYVLKSKKTGKLYVGYSESIRKQLLLHNKGKVDATKYGRPWELVYFEGCLSKENALKREKYLKTGFGRRFLKTRL